MTRLQTLQGLAAQLNREERALNARDTARGADTRWAAPRASSGRTGRFLARFRAQLTLVGMWVAQNAPAIRETAHRAKSGALNYAGAALVAYGAWTITEPAGYIVGGILAWVLSWSSEMDRARMTGRE
ncbi:hypothetical protein ACPCI0_29155 [Streptomyces griseoincarnatus]